MARTPVTRCSRPCALTCRSCQSIKIGSMVTRPSWRPMLNAASSVASPRPITGDVDRTADFQKAGLLEVTDDEGVVSLALRVQSVADGLRRAAEFRQRMEEVVGRIKAMDLEPDAGTGGCVEQRL